MTAVDIFSLIYHLLENIVWRLSEFFKCTVTGSRLMLVWNNVEIFTGNKNMFQE